MKKVDVVAGIIRFDNKILCMQRDKGKHDYTSYKWEFPGGKIEEGETHQQALIRELKEEMEMEVDVLDHFMDVVHTYPDFEITMHVYACDTKNKEFKMNVHVDYKWLYLSDLEILDWAGADIPIVNKLLNK